MKTIMVALCLLGAFGCNKEPPDKCPKCGNPFIHRVDGFTGEKSVGCSQCNWEWK